MNLLSSNNTLNILRVSNPYIYSRHCLLHVVDIDLYNTGSTVSTHKQCALNPIPVGTEWSLYYAATLQSKYDKIPLNIRKYCHLFNVRWSAPLSALNIRRHTLLRACSLPNSMHQAQVRMKSFLSYIIHIT